MIEDSVLWRLNVADNNETYLGLHANWPIFLPDFNQTWIFTTDFHETHTIIFHGKNRPVGAALIQAGAWTDRWDVRTDGQDGSTVHCMVFGQRGGSGAGGRTNWVW